jgi:hypothetical protein
LDRDRPYGLLLFSKRNFAHKQVAEAGPNGRHYRRRSKVEHRPRSEQIAIPVPDAGIDCAVVDTAREALKGNRRPFKNDNRSWPLSGGISWCGLCGRRVRTHTAVRPNERRHLYYQSSRRGKYGTAACPAPNNHRAENLKSIVWA